jgi:hypothetical protein
VLWLCGYVHPLSPCFISRKVKDDGMFKRSPRKARHILLSTPPSSLSGTC